MGEATQSSSGADDVLRFVVIRAAERRGAVPVELAIETMRPLPIETIAGAPDCITGVAMVRGAVTPVVDFGRLSTGQALAKPRRWLRARAGDQRAIVLAVDEVVAVIALPAAELDALDELPGTAPIVSAAGSLLSIVLATRLVPDELWERLAAEPRA